MKQTMQPISVIVPTLNEEGNLAPLFRRIHTTLSSSRIPYEIIVVDDYSTDHTAQIVRGANPRYNVRLLMKQGRPGKAFSLLEGFKAAENDLICMIDADLQYPPEAIKLMYHKLQYCEADVVITERIQNEAGPVRRLTSYVFNLLFTRMLFGIRYDTQSGLKLFHKNVLKTLNLEPSPWTFDLEFIVRALEQNYVVVSQTIPFAKRNSGVPKLHLMSATAEIASQSFFLWRRTSIKRVRLSYKHSQGLQQGLNWLFVLIAGTFLLGVLPAGHASAAQNRSDRTVQDQRRASRSDDTDRQPATQAIKKAVSAVTAPPATVSASQEQPTEPTAPTPAATPASSTSSTSSSAAVNTGAATTPAATMPATQNTAAGTGLSEGEDGSAAKTVRYYPASKLSSTKTERLLKIALIVFEAGAALIGIGILAAGIRKLAGKSRRQPVRA
jgi:dolichol-phosphate mannosyltransferase